MKGPTVALAISLIALLDLAAIVFLHIDGTFMLTCAFLIGALVTDKFELVCDRILGSKK